ncbi:hypothetical protein [Blattabacterium cuenoti]|uniref:hypothetical protein n=1 Tax=Blattabacterium cuenoti TaxID=1653831 RepID=UPI00163CF1AC|nr:hypothetical protein [Blattabacterium cuenoti]
MMIQKVCSYIRLTKKYEPTTWENIIGQKDIVYILKHAVKKCVLSKILLFIGIKGIGKNTCAKILINELSSSNIVHKFELNGTIKYSINYLNSIINKIYNNVTENKCLIIQNINDVSTNFIDIIFPMFYNIPLNMLLIICANKINKIVEYIMSSLYCQTYEFNPISIKDNFNHLKNISNKECIEIDNETLLSISKYGNGSLMNSMNQLDKLYFHTILKHKISKKLILNRLGILDTIYYFKIIDYLLKNKIYEFIMLLDNIIKINISSILFIKGFIKHFRMLLISKYSHLNSLLKDKNNLKFYIQQSKMLSSLFIIDSLKMFCQIEHKLYDLRIQNVLYDNKHYYKLIETKILSFFLKKKNNYYSNHESKNKNYKYFKYFLEQNWKSFIDKNSNKINPYYLNILKNEIQFYILNNKIVLIKPSIIKEKDFLVIQKYFTEKLQKKCNNQYFEFEILTKKLENFSVEEYNMLSKKNDNINQLIDRLKLKIKSPCSLPPPITYNSIKPKIKDNY